MTFEGGRGGVEELVYARIFSFTVKALYIPSPTQRSNGPPFM